MSRPLVLKDLQARSLGQGWHAQELCRRAQVARVSMAQQWANEHPPHGYSAFSVPAHPMKIVAGKKIVYRFLDGSETEVVVNR